MNGAQLANPAHLTATDTVISTLARPVVLPLGDVARTAPCLLCGEAIGGELADQVVVWPVRQPPCNCGRVIVVAFLVHARHELPGAADIADVTRAVLVAAHGQEGDL